MQYVNAPIGASRAHQAAPTKPLVYVVDDDDSVRESLELLIPCAGWRIETFRSAREFLARPPLDCPCCLVLDVSLPDLDGLDVQRQLRRDGDGIPIIFITGHGDIPMSVQAMKHGALDFLPKPFTSEVLLRAIRDGIERSETARLDHAETRAIRVGYESLSQRQREVLRRVVAGWLNKRIAADLGISEITVKAHRGQVMRKMHADSLADLVRMATRLDAA